MKIVYERKLTEFAQRHPNVRSAIDRWRALMEQGSFGSIVELRETFPHADPVRVKVRRTQPTGIRASLETTVTIFNIGGNKARLITSVQYELQQITIHEVLTHAAYNKWNRRI